MHNKRKASLTPNIGYLSIVGWDAVLPADN